MRCRPFLLLIALLPLPLHAAVFHHSDASVRARVETSGDGVTLIFEGLSDTLLATELEASEGDVEIRDLPDGSAVPALAHSGKLGSCSVSVDIGLEEEAAWLTLFDCEPDTQLPPETSLVLLPASRPAFPGNWRRQTPDDNADIEITDAGDGWWSIYGLATKQVSPTSIHDAEFSAQVEAVPNNALTFELDTPAGCRISMTLVNETLNVEDNERCGGRGVSFDGSYSRRHD